jgi:hypothetical protein
MKKKFFISSKNPDSNHSEIRAKLNKELKVFIPSVKLQLSGISNHNNFWIDTDMVSKTPSSNIGWIGFSTTKMQYAKSPRIVENIEFRKKYISPRTKKEKAKISTSKSKENSQNRYKGIDKKYFEYIRHNESANYNDNKKARGFTGINISIQEVDNKPRNKSYKKPQYGTGNMSHIIALLNDQKSATMSSKKSKRNTSNHVSMKKLSNTSKGKSE